MRLSQNVRHLCRITSQKPQGPGNLIQPRVQSMSTSIALLQQTPSHHLPNTHQKESNVYVLTLLTDAKHNEQLTKLRTKYFPSHLNHLGAHITLFHSLPGSKLETVESGIEKLAKSTTQYRLLATTPFKLNKGIAIGVPKSAGGDQSREVHLKLKNEWVDFLSKQDNGGFAPHYTVMNKVDDQKEVDKAFTELEKDFKAVKGTVEGVRLWRYDTHGWEFYRDFKFETK